MSRTELVCGAWFSRLLRPVERRQKQGDGVMMAASECMNRRHCNGKH
jgi:hypothetical protein